MMGESLYVAAHALLLLILLALRDEDVLDLRGK